MEIGIVVPNGGNLADAGTALAVAERAEALGLDSVWTVDHLMLPRSPSGSYPYVRAPKVSLDPDHVFLDPLITLAALAARTERVRLGVGVLIAPLRHPLVTAKMIASLDQLSGGRVLLGVGLGWIREEYAALGLDWRERGVMLDEQIRCLRELWTRDTPEFRGRFYAFGDLGFQPKPVGRHVPLWVGGNSERALRRAARLGDGWHGIDLSPPALERTLETLERVCGEEGRSREEVRVSMRFMLRITDAPVSADERLFPLTGTLDQVVGDLRAVRALGVDHLILAPWAMDVDRAGYLERVEQVAREIKPALDAPA